MSSSFAVGQCTIVIMYCTLPLVNSKDVMIRQQNIEGWETQRQDEHSQSHVAGSPASGGTSLLHLSNLGKLWCMQTAYHTSLAGLLLELITSRGDYRSQAWHGGPKVYRPTVFQDNIGAW